jgi:hypothetical protein
VRWIIRSWLFFLFLLVGVLGTRLETEDARSVLQAAFAKYGNLSVFYIEGTQESTTTDDIERNWQQEQFIVAKAPGNRYHYNIKSPGRWNIVIADGIREWDFQPWRNEYMKRPALRTEPDADDPDDVIRHVAASGARYYVEELSQVKIKTADFLPPENLTFAGQQVPCYVIRARQSTENTALQSAELTFWIEKRSNVVRKEAFVSRSSPLL